MLPTARTPLPHRGLTLQDPGQPRCMPSGPQVSGNQNVGTPYDGLLSITAFSCIHAVPGSYFVSRPKMEKNKYKSPATFLKNMPQEK